MRPLASALAVAFVGADASSGNLATFSIWNPVQEYRHNWGAVRGLKSVYKEGLHRGTIRSVGEWGAGNSQREELRI